MRPRLRLAIAYRAPCSTASLRRWTHQVGVASGTRANDTPTSYASRRRYRTPQPTTSLTSARRFLPSTSSWRW